MTLLGEIDNFIQLDKMLDIKKSKAIDFIFQNCLLKLVNDKILPLEMYEAIRPHGSVRPLLYH